MQRARDRRRRQGQRIDVDGHLREFLLGRDAELLFLVDDQQPQVTEFDLLAQYFMGADQDVDTPRFEVGTYLPRLLGGLGAVEILDPHGEIAQALRKER